MTKPAVSPMSPTVHTVFAEFLKRLEADNTCTETALTALKNAIAAQTLDVQSLRDALFKEAPAETP